MDRLHIRSIDGIFQFKFLKEDVSAYFLFIALFLSLVISSSAIAQIGPLQIGDHVRITAPFLDPMDRIKGTVSEISGSVLVLSNKDSLIYISDSLIQSLEISTGKKRVIGRGFLIGAVTGTLVLGAVSAIRNDRCVLGESGCFLNESNGDAFISGGTTGLVVGGVAGAIAGFFIKIDRWERVPVFLAMDFAPASSYINPRFIEPKISVKLSLY